jgi:hypothetical protein
MCRSPAVLQNLAELLVGQACERACLSILCVTRCCSGKHVPMPFADTKQTIRRCYCWRSVLFWLSSRHCARCSQPSIMHRRKSGNMPICTDNCLMTSRLGQPADNPHASAHSNPIWTCLSILLFSLVYPLPWVASACSLQLSFSSSALYWYRQLLCRPLRPRPMPPVTLVTVPLTRG